MFQDIKLKSILKIVGTAFKYYILYVLIFGIVIFGFIKPRESNYLSNHEVERFFSDEVSQDRVALIEGRYESGLARIDLIKNAEKTLDIAYYTMHSGQTLDIFLGCILDAADRGVQVRVLLDGLFHNLRGSMRDAIYMFCGHPNIELKLYEPLSLLKVWNWNNRLHDKMIIQDEKIAMMGGRNIGDKYFVDNEYLDIGYDGIIVNDRDVAIINTDIDCSPSSGVGQLKKYYDMVWDHEFSKEPISKLSEKQGEKGRAMARTLSENFKNIKAKYTQIFEDIDWEARSVPVNKVTLIHNPIDRLNKEPWCWYELVSLAMSAEKSIFIQSPYVIPTDKMLRGIEDIAGLAVKTTILTNAIATNPNPMGTAGYINIRDKIVDAGATIYEFQGPGSVHAKTYIFDDRISLVGSFNMDARSAYLSTETMAVIDSKEFATILKGEIQKYKDESLVVDKDYSYIEAPLIEKKRESLPRKIIIRLLSIIAYIFDFLL